MPSDVRSMPHASCPQVCELHSIRSVVNLRGHAGAVHLSSGTCFHPHVQAIGWCAEFYDTPSGWHRSLCVSWLAGSFCEIGRQIFRSIVIQCVSNMISGIDRADSFSTVIRGPGENIILILLTHIFPCFNF